MAQKSHNASMSETSPSNKSSGLRSSNEDQGRGNSTGNEISQMIPAYRRQVDGLVFKSAGPGEGHSRFADRLGIDDTEIERNPTEKRGKQGFWTIQGFDFGLVDASERFWTMPELEAHFAGESKEVDNPYDANTTAITARTFREMAQKIKESKERDLEDKSEDSYADRNDLHDDIRRAIAADEFAQAGALCAALNMLRAAGGLYGQQLTGLPGIVTNLRGDAFMAPEIVVAEIEAAFHDQEVQSVVRAKKFENLPAEDKFIGDEEDAERIKWMYGPIQDPFLIGHALSEQHKEHLYYSLQRNLPEDGHDEHKKYLLRIYFEGFEDRVEGGSVNTSPKQDEYEITDFPSITEAVYTAYQRMGLPTAALTQSAPAIKQNLNNMVEPLNPTEIEVEHTTVDNALIASATSLKNSAPTIPQASTNFRVDSPFSPNTNPVGCWIELTVGTDASQSVLNEDGHETMAIVNPETEYCEIIQATGDGTSPVEWDCLSTNGKLYRNRFPNECTPCSAEQLAFIKDEISRFTTYASTRATVLTELGVKANQTKSTVDTKKEITPRISVDDAKEALITSIKKLAVEFFRMGGQTGTGGNQNAKKLISDAADRVVDDFIAKADVSSKEVIAQLKETARAYSTGQDDSGRFYRDVDAAGWASDRFSVRNLFKDDPTVSVVSMDPETTKMIFSQESVKDMDAAIQKAAAQQRNQVAAVVTLEKIDTTEPVPKKQTTTTIHSLYKLHLEDPNPSPTKWLIENAESTPQRLLKLLSSRQHAVAWGAGEQSHGWLFSGVAGEELIQIKDIGWDRPPDLIGALDQEKSLTRPLKVTFEIRSVDGRVQQFTRSIPDLPFPTPWGTYVIGANQELLANKLVQKPGIFPVNLQETGKLDASRNGILWHTTTASLLQTERNIVAIVRSLTNGLRNDGGRNKAVIIPKEAWPELDAAMGHCRRSNHLLEANQFPRLAAAFRAAHGTDSRLDAPLTSWVKELAHCEVPDGTWASRIERLGGDVVGKSLAESKRWSFTTAQQAETLRQKLDQDDFIPFSSLARMRVQTGADLLAEMLAQLIDSRIQEVVQNPQHRSVPANNVLSGLWKTTNWRVTQDLVAATRTGTDRNNKTLANEKTPAETALRVNLLLREGHLFGTPSDISEIQRNFHAPSSMYFLSGITMENASVGNALHMLPQTRVRSDSGELECPFAVRNEKGEWEKQWLGSEQLEALEDVLAKKGQGLALGRPDTMPGTDSTPVNLHYRGQVAARVPKAEIPAYFDAAPEDTLAMGLRMSPDNAQVEVARHAIALAFINGASSCYGSEADPDYSKDASETCAKLLNTGKFVRSPVSGTVVSVNQQGRIGTVILQEPDGKTHRIEYPVDLSNAFSNATGMTCVACPGDVVERGNPLIAPEQPCVLNSIHSKTPGVFPAVPLRAAEFSIGEEDLLVLNAGVQASGKLTILKQGNTAAIKGSDGPIRLAVAHPGTMILPGMLLGWQMRQNRDNTQTWQEIRAGDTDRGILANIFVVPDKSGAGHSVEVAPEAFAQKPDMARHIQEIITGVVADFIKIADGWSAPVVDLWAEQGKDVRRPYEEAHVWLWSHQNQKWEAERISLNGVRAGAGSRDYDLLSTALLRPTSEVVFGGVEEGSNARIQNFLETRLHNAHRFAKNIEIGRASCRERV